jgi:predicted DNA-binding protein (MmcQ/YjbR family)
VTPRQIAAYCLTLPQVTRVVQWEGVQVFKVGGKMFCLVAPSGHSVARISFKCDPAHYDALCRADGFAPAPYLARAKWVSLTDPGVLTAAETKAYLRRAHQVIAAALPRKKQRELGFG